MPTIAPTKQPTGNIKSVLYTWAPLALGDDGEPAGLSQYADKSVQVSGVFGGATLAIEGSNDGSNWAPLSDPQGNNLNFTAAKIEMVSEATQFIRPRVVGGDGTTALNVSIFMKE